MTRTKRPSAYNLALQQVQGQTPQNSEDTVLDSETPSKDSKTAKRQNGETPQNSAKSLEKVTFYLEPEQVEKLYDLMHEYRKQTGLRINRNDIVRRLIDVSSLDTVLPSSTAKR